MTGTPADETELMAEVRKITDHAGDQLLVEQLNGLAQQREELLTALGILRDVHDRRSCVTPLCTAVAIVEAVVESHDDAIAHGLARRKWRICD